MLALLIDSRHKWWFVATLALGALAVWLHGFLGRHVSGGLRGGSAVGLWYGIVGSLLMLFAGALAAHRRLPVRRWIGSRQTWLRAHIWIGLLSVVVILCHGNYALGGPLTVALWIVLGITILSGVFGLLLQAILPRLITTHIYAEGPFEQIPHLCDLMCRDCDESIEAALGNKELTPLGAQELRNLHTRVRHFLHRDYDARSSLASPIEAEAIFAPVREHPDVKPLGETVDRLQRLCEERRQLAEQARLHRLLHVWLMIHIPITIALLVLGVVHAVMSVYW
jgi:hypothetical protein